VTRIIFLAKGKGNARIVSANKRNVPIACRRRSDPFYTSNQIPTNFHVGTPTNCSEAYFASWPSALVGMRSDLRFQVRVLDERFIVDSGECGLLSYLRADVQLEHPELFSVVIGIRP
jgi:hypothetical protein